MSAMIQVENLSFYYRVLNEKSYILRDLTFSIERGDLVAIQGPSGSGKSTLFYILGCMLKPKSGKIYIDGMDLEQLSPTEMTLFRNQKIGFVFQQFHLLPRASVLDNILLPTKYPCEFRETSHEERDKARCLAERLGLTSRLSYLPNHLSGGQQQRVAIARALMNDIDLILADEPTGNLDTKNSTEIMQIFKELNAQGKTIVLITHDPEVASQCSTVLQLRDGQLIENGSREVSTRDRNGELEKSNRSSFARVVRAALPRAWENLFRNRLRSVLTMLGVVIGIASVLAMITFGKFTQKKILESYEALGVNKLSIHGYENWRLRAVDKFGVMFQEFDEVKDFPVLRRLFPQIKYISPTYESYGTEVSFGGKFYGENYTHLVGTTPEFQQIGNRTLAEGVFIDPYHVVNMSPVCLIGKDIAEFLFPSLSPVGQIVFIKDGGYSDALPVSCKVLGVMERKKATNEWATPNREVLLPSTFYKNIVSGPWMRRLHYFSIQLESGSDVERIGKGIEKYFESKYGVTGRFGADSDTILVAQMRKFLLLFSLMLSSIAFISLTVGGIGINNMMLVSVNERLREIGLLKAIGATDESIRLQFIIESTILCCLAGLVGAVIGFAAYEGIIFVAAKFVDKLKFEWVIDPTALLISVAAIFAVGIISGLTPARRAERLEVIEALRSE